MFIPEILNSRRIPHWRLYLGQKYKILQQLMFIFQSECLEIGFVLNPALIFGSGRSLGESCGSKLQIDSSKKINIFHSSFLTRSQHHFCISAPSWINSQLKYSSRFHQQLFKPANFPAPCLFLHSKNAVIKHGMKYLCGKECLITRGFFNWNNLGV